MRYVKLEQETERNLSEARKRSHLVELVLAVVLACLLLICVSVTVFVMRLT